jgi:hypothetical protein
MKSARLAKKTLAAPRRNEWSVERLTARPLDAIETGADGETLPA